MTILEIIESAMPFQQVTDDLDVLDTFFTVVFAGQDPDPRLLEEGVACWNCFSEPELESVFLMLLCQLGAMDCSSENLITQGAAVQQVEDSLQALVNTYLLYLLAAQ